MPRAPKTDPAQASPEEVLLKAVDLLKRRAHAELELRQKLKQRHYPAAHIDAALARCRAEGWLGDADFARTFADELVRSRRYGPRRVVQKLQERGVARDLAEQVLAEVAEEVDWSERARALIERRTTDAPMDTDERARQTRFLMARGFSGAEISAALRDRPRPGPDDDV